MHRRIIIIYLLALFLCGCNSLTITVPCGDVTKLKDAIHTANQNLAADLIKLEPGCTYKLNSIDNLVEGNNGLPVITSEIVIEGNDSTIVRVIEGTEYQFRLLYVSADGNLTLQNLTLENGHASGSPPGLFSENGGAILNLGEVSLISSRITGNQANGIGGGIRNDGTLRIMKSTFEKNEAPATAGLFNSGDVIITQSAFIENGVQNWADGIWSGDGGTLDMSNSTVSGNGGSGIDNEGQLNLNFVTIVNNGNGGILSVSGTVTYKNTLFGTNTPGSCNQSSVFNPQGINIDTDGTCQATMVLPNNLQLMPLADNGGPTKTHALDSGSMAIDATADCLPVDQRGVHRPQGGDCDVGAYEYDGAFMKPTSTITVMPESVIFLTPTSTSTPLTPTPTSTPEACTYTAVVNVFCRTGPGGSIYPEVDSFLTGQSAPVYGFSPDRYFAQVQGINNLVACYVPLGGRYGLLSGACEDLPLLNPPPPPPTATQPLEGCTVRQAGGEIICVYPCPVGVSPGEVCLIP